MPPLHTGLRQPPGPIEDVDESDLVPDSFKIGPSCGERNDIFGEVDIDVLNIIPGTSTSFPCLAGKYNKFYSGKLI